MKFKVINEKISNLMVDILIIGIYEEVKSLGDVHHTMDQQLGGLIQEMINAEEFKGEEGETLLVHTLGRVPAKKCILLGLGKAEAFKENNLRNVVAKVMREARKSRAETIAITPFGICNHISAEKVGQAIAEGTKLGLYQFNHYKTTAKEQEERVLQEVYILNEETGITAQLQTGIDTGEKLAHATMIARDLVNEPGNVLTPTEMAKRAQSISQKHGLELEILEKEDMERLGMGCFLGVTAGSEEPPKLMVLKYNGGEEGGEILGLVGKGLTFDSGGISIKPGEGMDAMKGDMGGAAAVLGAMEAIGALKPKTNVIAVVGACENMPSGKAYKPGDILTSKGGKTVEILNTDAEGRLVLVDCVSYALQLGATRLVDLATLTGACLIALGTTTTALISNDELWVKQIEDASKNAGEQVWQLPSFPEYKEMIKSEIADLKNIGGKYAGAITAGLFVGEFAEGKPWVHMDIAGTSMSDKEKGYITKGGTGVAVRTLYELAKSMEK
ncbi:Leucyl aminopeptidase [Alkaliphilus metalliredigens QYMF]|uniref:Probable cytosol aminopeptidase n=1 Tax=Alkaliphilus metalliredigens (strain QYMF) TaxID=293826 RepID=AMPA_ALKMQ|nr:leucyl aminopeptidase [Alkaliphilus metalliredigens]A6TWW9.1 RecName: Full=Probable cytosol aminopeptidase; AltName: Full=Leucine aminopeptidase; Short=LAP; AltName: Full=Leucyl aminopeptidase [Alkaliphilus metalliredigens QYMF]ABR50687.1 Leucyl aminopeptidase [Alkaliphilus metalliredigens QYMF]